METAAKRVAIARQGVQMRSVVLSAQIEALVIQQYIVDLVYEALGKIEPEIDTARQDDLGCELSTWLDERPHSPLARAFESGIGEDLEIWNSQIATALSGLPGTQQVKAVLTSEISETDQRFAFPRTKLTITAII